MSEKEKLNTEESNYHTNYECRWCGHIVLEKDLDSHLKECEEL